MTNNLRSKYTLRPWVVYILIMIQFVLTILLASDYPDLKVFFISKIIELILFMINIFIIYRYTNIFDEE